MNVWPNDKFTKITQRKAQKPMNLNHPAYDPDRVIEFIKGAAPFYGGTSPGSTVPAAVTPPTTPPAPETTAGTVEPATAPPGGSADDPIAKLAADPNALGQLLAQVDKLQKDLETAQGVVKTHEDKAAEEQRKQQTREQQLESDLAQRDAVIQQMDTVVRNMAIVNAMQSQKDLRWNSVKQAVAELAPEDYEIDINLEKGTADVTGIDVAAQRIAKDCPWLVQNPGTTDTSTKPATPRRPASSGTPPAPPTTDPGKQDRRKRLMSRYQVINH